MKSRGPLVCVFLWVAFALFPFAAVAQTLVITNGVQTCGTLSNTAVTMTGRSELRVTGTNNPIAGSLINLNSSDAWFLLPNLRPSVVSASYLSQVRVNGAAAVAGANCRLDPYAMGSVIIPHPPAFTPLQVFTGPNFVGTSAQFRSYTFYTNNVLGVLNKNIGSFKLKRGYSATFAQNADGTGISKVFVAQDGDLEIGVMAADLDHACSFIRIIPWRWTSKKGYGGGDGATTICEPLWFYDWGDSSTSTLDREFIPIKWGGGGNYNNINGKQNSTQVLGYNEPDSCAQANQSVADTLANWPLFMQSGLRAGAPAVSDSGMTGEGLDWLYNFMDQAIARGYRVDYIPIHWYKCGQSPTQMSNYLATVYQKYGRPIWLTEWNNGASWCQGDLSYSANATAINNFVNMLESAPFVERYAIYPWWSDTSGLCVVTNGVLTPVGAVYRARQSALAYAQVLPAGGSRSIAQFHFETNTLDSSGYGNNGFAQGIPGYANGRVGQGVVLEGTNSFLRLPSNVANSADFSFAGWVFWNGGASSQRIFDFGDDGTHYLFLTPNSSSGTLRFAIRNGGSEQVLDAPGLPAGQWRHVAVTLSGGNVKLYANGVLAASSSGFSILPSNFNPSLNYLGKSQLATDPLFSGLLDEVQIADYAFTATQVAALMTDAPPQFSTSLLSGGSATPGVAYSGSIAGTATDPDAGDTLTYSKAGGPAWLAVAPDGTLSGTPGIYDIATNNFTVRATDAAGASAFAVVTISLPSTANSGTWTADADGNWTDTSKWSGGLPAKGAGVTADFSVLPAGASRTATLDSSRTVGALKFAARSWSLTASGGSVLTLENSSLTSPSILVNQSNATITAPLSGWNGFTKSGTGTLILATNNALTGVVNVDTGSTSANDGVVRVAHPSAMAGVSAIRFRNNTGASAGSTLQLDGTAGNITLNTPMALAGRNTSVPAIQNVAGANTLNGDIAINVGGANYLIQSDGGLLTFAGLISPVSTGARTVTFQGAGNAAVTGFLENGCATVSLIKSGAGLLTLSSVNTYTGGTTVNGGTLNLAKGGSSGTVRSTLNINPGATVNLTAADALGYTNAGSGVTFVTTVNLVGGNLNNAVSGNNGFNTDFNLTGGTMSSSGGGAFNFDGATGAGLSSLASASVSTVSGNVVLRSAGVVFSTAVGSVPGGVDLNISGAISGAFPITKSGAGTLALSGTNTYSGATTISAGMLLISGAGRLGSGTYAASITNNGTFKYNSSQAQTVSGGISGTGALMQSGPGTLTLSGAATYSGNTGITGGRLALGSGATVSNTPLITLAAGGALDVAASGLTIGAAQTLSGVGAVVGNLSNRGTLVPGGNGGGVLTCSNNVTLNAGGTTSFKLNKAAQTNDQLRVIGTLNHGGTLAITNLSGTLSGGDAFKLFSASSYSGNFSNLAGSPGPGLEWKLNPTNGVLAIFSTVPPNLSVRRINGFLELSWPADHVGWALQVQTSDLTAGLRTNWIIIPNSTASTQFVTPFDSTSQAVFYRLIYP